jgi:FKBP-type peptidyl-prolyl cis-trans isomerase FkpA/FKBP-type peptidyl-prolyl cis-trans isomerase FklB
MSLKSNRLFSILCLAVFAAPVSSLVAQDQGGIPGIKPSVIATEMSEEEAMKKASLFMVYKNLEGMIAQLKEAGIELDKDQALEGARKALAGETLEINDEEARSFMMPVQKKMMAFQEQRQKEAMAQREQMMAQMKEMAEKNKTEGEAFLAENAKKEGVQTLAGGVQYEVMVEGTGPKPKLNSQVKINYHGTFPDGKVFDSTVEARPGKTPGPVELNSGIFVNGFKTALHSMPEGSKWKIVIPGDEAYGLRGRAPVIGPNQTIVFELELLEVSEPAEGQ